MASKGDLQKFAEQIGPALYQASKSGHRVVHVRGIGDK